MTSTSTLQPHHERPEGSRAAILAAARRVFAKAGLAGARTDAIAAQAGVNKALLYYYFKSKRELYEAVIEDHFLEFHRRAMQVLTAEGSPRAILLAYINLHFDFLDVRKATLFQQMMMAGDKRMKRLVRKYFAPRVEAFGRLIERGVRTGEFRPVHRDHTTMSIAALIVFYFSCAPVMRALGRTQAYTRASVARRRQEVLDFVRYAVFKHPEVAPE